MSALKKARLAEINAAEPPQEVGGTSVPVQFNPGTMRVQISNRTAGGAQAGAQARQRPGTGEMQVSFDLVFDTADEGRAGAGISVLERTKTVERFVRPRGNQAGQEAPPRVLFEWGAFQVQGVMESANIDLDLFDADGVPLRAKVAVTIKGQDPRWRYQASPAAQPPGSGSGAGAGRPAGMPALPAGAPGTAGLASAVDRLVQALPGESLAQLAARNGLAPEMWRALAQGIGDPLKLALGQEVALPATKPAAAADGGAARSQDPQATGAALPLMGGGVPVAGAASGGLGSRVAPPSSAAAAAAADPVRAGQALAAQGGARGAIEQRRGQVHADGASRALAAFGLPDLQSAALDQRPWGSGVPLRPRRGGSTVPATPKGVAATVLPGASAARWTSRCGCGGGCGRCSGR